MSLLAVLLLAVLQGVTEFLPVSSSGHLALGGMLLRVPEGDITFEVTLHVGTLLAVLAVYRADIAAIISGLARGERRAVRTALLLALASVPAAAAGLLLGDFIEGVFEMPLVVSCLLLVNGGILFASGWARRTASRDGSPGSALSVGLAQALALLPGISRSGSTISTGMLSGMDRTGAARFSFLLSVPAIAGAAALKLGEATRSGPGLPVLAAGLVVSALTGYAALRLLLRFVHRGRLSVFAWYCWAVGLIGIVLSLAGGGA